MAEQDSGSAGAGNQLVAFDINPRRFNRNLLLLLIGIEVVLLLSDWFISYAGWINIGMLRGLLDMTTEGGLLTWYRSTLIFVTGAFLLVIYLSQRRSGATARNRWWLVFAFFFIYMSADDASQIHERFGADFKAGIEKLGGTLDFFPTYTWQLVLAPVFAVFGFLMLWFLWSQLRERNGRLKLFAGLACYGTAVGLDFIEGLGADNPLNIYALIWKNTGLGETPVVRLGMSIEEFLQMLAITLLLSAFFVHYSLSTAETRVRFAAQPEGARENRPVMTRV
jgi:hypothetical protein